MPYFRVMVSGTGISYGFNDGSDPIIGFFTTRMVKANDLPHAHQCVKELVLSEWRLGGSYAADNHGALPTLAVEDSSSVGYFAGLFGRKGGGYAFYTQE
jgi:hypothetical protein